VRKQKDVLFEEQSDHALPLLNLGGAGQGPLRGDVSPFKVFSRLSRSEKTSRDDSKRISSDREESSGGIFDRI